jgi:hypothetical protein
MAGQNDPASGEVIYDGTKRSCIRRSYLWWDKTIMPQEKSLKGAGLQMIHSVNDMYSFGQCSAAHYIPPFFEKTRPRVYTKLIEVMTKTRECRYGLRGYIYSQDINLPTVSKF